MSEMELHLIVLEMSDVSLTLNELIKHESDPIIKDAMLTAELKQNDAIRRLKEISPTKYN